MKPFRINLIIAGKSADVSFRAHEKDDTLLVLKSHDPEAFDNLLILTGYKPTAPVSAFKGAANHITILTKDDASKLLAATVLQLATKAEAHALVNVASADGDSSDDGASDDDEPYED